jgi:hypothetical protein
VGWISGSDFAGSLPSSALVAISVLFLGSGVTLGVVSRTRFAQRALRLLAVSNGPSALALLAWAAAARPSSPAAAAMTWSAGAALAGLAAIQLRTVMRATDPRSATVAG